MKYKILYEIKIFNKLIKLGFIARFTKSLKKYFVLNSQPLNILIILIRFYIYFANNIELIDFT